MFEINFFFLSVVSTAYSWIVNGLTHQASLIRNPKGKSNETLFVLGVCTPNNRIIQLNLTQNSVGRLSSPDYPLQLPSVSSCFWRLKAPDGYCVKLSFTSLNIKGECEEEGHREELMRVDDYFTTDFGSVTSFWGHFCKDVQPQVIYSTRNELQIFFTSNYSNGKDYSSDKPVDPNSATGFYGTYQVTPQGK